MVPDRVLCIELNYRKHAEETEAQVPDHPILFMSCRRRCRIPKGTSCCRVSCAATMWNYEPEPAVVIDRPGRPSRATSLWLGYVLEYTCGNSDLQWCQPVRRYNSVSTYRG